MSKHIEPLDVQDLGWDRRHGGCETHTSKAANERRQETSMWSFVKLPIDSEKLAGRGTGSWESLVEVDLHEKGNEERMEVSKIL